ncbi:restriction endonuclease subunit S [Streptococcus infantis]|uniref:restriction endonuclease subunit S n=1 Tax=Streptococcus infantis TaxID=68892 RepID=UPI0039C3FCD6
MKKVKLGEVCEIRIGKTPNRSQTLYWGGDYPWLSISDMKGKILCTTKEKITQEAVQKEKMQIVSKGTVVMSFKLSIGKVGILAENMYTNEAIANFVVKNNKMLFNEYLYYALQGINFDSLTDRAVMGKTLNKAKLNNLSIVYNEPFMQQQIVLRLDGVNKLIESRKQQLSELSKLVKSRFNEMFGDPVLNEMGWEIETLNKIGTIGRGVSKHRPRNASELFGGIYPFIQTGDVANSGNYIVDYHSTYSEFGLKQSKLWDKGTLCITIAANIAKTSILAFDSCFPDSIVGFIPGERTNNMFIHYWFSYFQKILESQAPESAQKNINLKILSELKVILPPLSLQNEFADFVAQVDKSQLAIQKSLEELETLKKSLMQEYFG